MKAAIIAAGQGTRLAAGGIKTPKPLTPVDGVPLISRAIQSAVAAGASSVACIVNAITDEVPAYLHGRTWPVPLDLVVKTTPSSMESLFNLAPLLQEEPFLLLTVDAVFKSTTLQAFVEKAQHLKNASGVLALTDYIDDTKPLYVRTDSQGIIRAIGETAAPSPVITSGFYFLEPNIFRYVETARARRMTALRQFLGLLIEKELTLYGVLMGPTIDVDTPEDIVKAEQFLKDGRL